MGDMVLSFDPHHTTPSFGHKWKWWYGIAVKYRTLTLKSQKAYSKEEIYAEKEDFPEIGSIVNSVAPKK